MSSFNRRHPRGTREIRKAYDSLADYVHAFNDPSSSYSTWHMNRRRLEILLSNLTGVKNGVALDVGCGYGYFLDALSVVYEMVVGVDVSVRMLSKAGKRNSVHLIVADAEHLPFRQNVFNCTIALNVFLHLLRPEKTIAEIARVSQQAALVLIETINKFSPILFFKKFGYLFDSGSWTRKVQELLGNSRQKSHIRYYSEGEIRSMCCRWDLTPMSHITYLLVGTQFPHGLALVAAKFEHIVEVIPFGKYFTLMSLHSCRKF